MGTHVEVKVATTAGPVVGRRRPADVSQRRRSDTCVFLGIPYADARRFQAPEPPNPWLAARPAIAPAPVAPQPASLLERLSGNTGGEMSEAGCLAVNVFTPAADGERRPVLFWIHGGAFVTGAGSSPWYDGSRFAANHDVVVVSCNYRLGALGFLELTDHGLPDAANAGMLDQIAALRWVRDNVPAFGGDPENVTLFGESAGAMSVATLLGMPAADGLYRRAILQSGAAAHVHTAEAAARARGQFLSALELAGGTAVTETLPHLTVPALLAAQNAVVNDAGMHLPFLPSVDGRHLPEPPLARLRAAGRRGVDLLVGTTRDEMRLFTAFDGAVAALDDAGVIARTARQAGVAPDVAAAIVARYRAAGPAMAPGDLWSELATDIVFRRPGHDLLCAQQSSARCWQYEFRWPSRAFDGRLGACHGLELPFVFDTLDAPGIEMFTGVAAGATDDDRPRVSEAMHGAWASFARTGDPGGEAWPTWDPVRRNTRVFDRECRLEQAPRAAELDLWPS